VNKTVAFLLALAALVAISLPAWSQATWEGPTGVFLNPLALTIGDGKQEVSAHFLDLEPIGSLTTFGYVYGLNKDIEVGYTRASLSAGAPSTFSTDILHAKWIALPFKDQWPQVAVGAIARSTHGGDSTDDFYLVATKVFQTSTPIIASVDVRNTNAAWSGLLGRTDERDWLLGGFLGFQVSPKLIVGAEYYGQDESRPWRDIAVRYNVGNGTNIDAGIARFNDTWDNQVAVAISHQW
jgi:hypothetical protein